MNHTTFRYASKRKYDILYILTKLYIYYTLPMLHLGKSSPGERVPEEIDLV